MTALQVLQVLPAARAATETAVSERTATAVQDYHSVVYVQCV